MTKKRVRIHDEYKYNAKKREKYCRLSQVQKYNLALAIDRYIKNGLSPSLIKKNIFDEFKSMKGSQMADSTYFDLKLNHKQSIPNGPKMKNNNIEKDDDVVDLEPVEILPIMDNEKKDEDVVDLVPVEDSAVTAKQGTKEQKKYSKKLTNCCNFSKK